MIDLLICRVRENLKLADVILASVNFELPKEDKEEKKRREKGQMILLKAQPSPKLGEKADLNNEVI